MKAIIAASVTLLAATTSAFAHSPAMHDPANKEKMQQMMNDPAHKEKMQQKMGGASGHNHAATKEQKDWGVAGDADKVSRTVGIAMSDDMKFTPNAINVKLGETIRFVVTNKGKVLHEMVIGTQKELEAHAEMMKKHPNMEHDEPYTAHADPGKSESIAWLFNRPGQFMFACLIPGHYEAGMKGTISVKP